MGMLYDLIKKEVEQMKEFFLLQQKNFIASRNFFSVRKAYENIRVIKVLTTSIDVNCKKFFGNQANYGKEFLKSKIGIIKPYIPVYSFDDRKAFPNYEELINKVEMNLNKE